MSVRHCQTVFVKRGWFGTQILPRLAHGLRVVRVRARAFGVDARNAATSRRRYGRRGRERVVAAARSPRSPRRVAGSPDPADTAECRARSWRT